MPPRLSVMLSFVFSINKKTTNADLGLPHNTGQVITQGDLLFCHILQPQVFYKLIT